MQRNRTDPIDKKLLAIYLKWSRSIERGESTLRNRDLLSEWSDGSLIEAIKYGRIYRLETLLKKVNDIIMGPIRRELVLIRIFERRKNIPRRGSRRPRNVIESFTGEGDSEDSKYYTPNEFPNKQ